MIMPPLERVARAIALSEYPDGEIEDVWMNYADVASAVLEEIRDAFDESGLVEAARQMAEMEGSEAATRASILYDGVVEWFDTALADGKAIGR